MVMHLQEESIIKRTGKIIKNNNETKLVTKQKEYHINL